MNTVLPAKIYATSKSFFLAQRIYQNLKNNRLTEVSLGKANFTWFSNENIQTQIDNVRGCLAVVVHTQTPPVSDGIVELFALLDAILNAGANDILLVFPYMPYTRSDRKNNPRISVMGHRLPHILVHSFGIKRVILLDPHDTHIKHYFDPAADEVSAMYLAVDYLKKIISKDEKKEMMVVFADAGAAAKYEKFAHLLELPTAFIEKKRTNDDENPEIKKIAGDVKNKKCLMLDDEILTGNTVLSDAQALNKAGAKEISYMIGIHAILNSKKIAKKELLRKLSFSNIKNFIITDSVPHDFTLSNTTFTKFIVLSIAPLLAEAIKRSIKGESLTDLHQLENVNLYT